MENKNNIWIEEEGCEIKEDRRIIFYESGIYESRYDNVGELFKSLQKNWGRCTSKVYRDVESGVLGTITQAIGWVFQKKEKYEDCNKYYLRETWVTLHEREPQTTIKYFYKEIA
jgi:hypothetical protein